MERLCVRIQTHMHKYIYHVEAHLNRFSTFFKNDKQMMCTCVMCLSSDYNRRKKNTALSSSVLYTVLCISIRVSKQRANPWIMQTLTDAAWKP